MLKEMVMFGLKYQFVIETLEWYDPSSFQSKLGKEGAMKLQQVHLELFIYHDWVFSFQRIAASKGVAARTTPSTYIHSL